MFWPIFGEAWKAMGANRLRTFLTMLGMIIGVAAVILMLAFGRGAQESVNKSIADMGTNLLMILSGSTTSGGLRMGMGSAPTLTIEDARAIAELPSIERASAVMSGTAQLVQGGNNWSSLVYGVTPDYLEVRNWALASGNSFDEVALRSATQVALLGQTVADNLFPDGENPLGKTIRIKNMPFLVIGLLEVKGQSMEGRNQDDAVVIPVTTAQRRLFGTRFRGSVQYIMAQAVSAELAKEAEQEITQLLRQRHQLGDNEQNRKPDDFTLRNLSELAQTAAVAARAFALLLGAIASISLLVGGIGIMNIMLVSVTERTREIGIRLAIGARRRDITLQFLLESILISLCGCLIGLIIGVGGSWLGQRLFDLPVLVTPSSVLLALSVASSIGIFFGLYPARRAARLNPIDALRQ
ncbi:MAG: ABC transporter permease [Pseudomonadales bacterium]|nr:ABC transporter permease [Pseudomonadales bacterium]